MLELNKVHNMNCLEGMALLDDASVNCCITSPPYWGLRDYDLPDVEWPAVEYSPMPGMPAIAVDAWSGSLGLESTIEGFVGHIVSVFREVSRVLRDDGTLWLNLGDCHITGRPGARDPERWPKQAEGNGRPPIDKRAAFLPNKNMAGIPWRCAFALQADGWYLRSDIIWHKPNPMPESVTDRPTKAHEYIFLLSKSAKYYYDAEAIKEPTNGNARARGNGVNPKAKIPAGWDQGAGAHRKKEGRYPGAKEQPERSRSSASERMGRGAGWRVKQNASMSSAINELVDERNKRSAWSVHTQPFSEAHFAVYPEKLITPAVLAGCPPGGIVLDPFDGAGTTRTVAAEYDRDCISFELNPDYIEISDNRYYVRTRQTLLEYK